MKDIFLQILEERIKQITERDYSAEHDDTHVHGELAKAASVYCDPTNISKWPWDKSTYKPNIEGTIDGRIHELVKAAALTVAEIERLQRLKEKK